MVEQQERWGPTGGPHKARRGAQISDEVSWSRSSAETIKRTQTLKPAGVVASRQCAPNRSTSAFKFLSGLNYGPRAGQQARGRRCPDEEDIRATVRTLSVPRVMALGHLLHSHVFSSILVNRGCIPLSAEYLQRTGSQPKDTEEARERLRSGPFTGSATTPWPSMPFPLATFLATRSCVISLCGLPLCSQAQLGTSAFLVPLPGSGTVCLPPLPVTSTLASASGIVWVTGT